MKYPLYENKEKAGTVRTNVIFSYRSYMKTNKHLLKIIAALIKLNKHLNNVHAVSNTND